MPSPRPVLCVIPTYLRKERDLDLTLRCLVSLSATAPGAAVVVVDDGSPARPLLDQLAVAVEELGYVLHPKACNEGFARTVNVGLGYALEHGCDAVLVNADIEFDTPGWLEAMLATADGEGRPAAVVGARLRYANGLLQHAGVAFSVLAQDWLHRFHYGPGDLPEAAKACSCPVTAALMLIRFETLEAIGVYDEAYGLAFEDVDYCLRVFDAGLECVYMPLATAIHHESMFRMKGGADARVKALTRQSLERLRTKWADADVGRFVEGVL